MNIVEIMLFLVTQLPKVLEMWLLMSAAQTFWTLVCTILAAVFLATGVCSVCFNGLYYYGSLQLQTPSDLWNALCLARYLMLLVFLVVCLSLMAFVAYTFIRSFLWMIVRYLSGVLMVRTRYWLFSFQDFNVFYRSLPCLFS